MFEPEELERLGPAAARRAEAGGSRTAKGRARGLDPIAGTEAIAYDFLAKGGKYSRPFITLAVYDALTGGKGTGGRRRGGSAAKFSDARPPGGDVDRDVPQGLARPRRHRRRRRVPLRRGDGAPQYGIATAINVGDYLIGLGYRLVSREAKALGAETSWPTFSIAWPTRTCGSPKGKGRSCCGAIRATSGLKPLDALKIYALKTAPAFEAALYTGAAAGRPGREVRRADQAVRPQPGRGVPDPQRPERLGRRRPQQARRRRRHPRRPADGAVGAGARRAVSREARRAARRWLKRRRHTECAC